MSPLAEYKLLANIEKTIIPMHEELTKTLNDIKKRKQQLLWELEKNAERITLKAIDNASKSTKTM